MIETLNIRDYTYPLPPDRIAFYPLEERDQSKLLVYQQGRIKHHTFRDLHQCIPENSLLFFNNTRVIQARILFHKESGAVIEVFLLNPVAPSTLLLQAMQAQGTCTWTCTIGNLKRWKPGMTLSKKAGDLVLEARLKDREQGTVEFTWAGDHTFAEMIHGAGDTPLPPYLKRDPEPSDRERYQTIYAEREGAVAAPTAGLHFTDAVLESLKPKHIKTRFLTLHVSAGTFQPVKEENALRHIMHGEQIVVTAENVETLMRETGMIIPVGTTSMRTLESLYWYGVKLKQTPACSFRITQDDPYILPQDIPVKEALSFVWREIQSQKGDPLIGETAIYIRPGYTFRMCNGLITNFHQPGSTLILLVAAFIGENWKSVYREALDNGYRFLSYGDSSLLLP